MKTIEKPLGAIIVISFVLKLALPFLSGPQLSASAINTLSLAALSMLYFFLSFALLNKIRLRDSFKKESYKDVSSRRLLETIFLGIVLGAILLGICFKMLHLAGGSMLAFFGPFVLLAWALVVFFRNRRILLGNSRDILIRAILISLASIMLVYIPMNRILYRNYPTYIDAVNRYKADPDNRDLYLEVQRQQEMIESGELTPR